MTSCPGPLTVKPPPARIFEIAFFEVNFAPEHSHFAQPSPQVLLDSNFTLVPYGSSMESFRLSEALEAGSIPITVAHPFYDLL